MARRLLLCGLLFGFVGLRPGRALAGNDRPVGDACLVVDTDVATDDFRAFGMLFPYRDLRAVVVTEGISSVPLGSTAIALYLASGQSLAPVIPGLASAAPPNYDWLAAVRAIAERINGLLAVSVPFAGDSNKLTHALAAALKGCTRVDVLVLGPWSSFIKYAPTLRPPIRRVIASGRPLSENNPDNFNCVYDQPACEKADLFLRATRNATWVDLPADGTSYPPTQEMVDQLARAGMPGLLRAALDLDPSQWLGTRLWDDTAALYLLEPESFRAQGAHLEPAIGEAMFRREWVKAVNGTLSP